MTLPLTSKIATDRASQEQYYHHRGGDPERTIQVRVAFEDIEEVLARIERGFATVEELVGIDIEELLVEGY